jgi:hypothetical protein
MTTDWIYIDLRSWIIEKEYSKSNLFIVLKDLEQLSNEDASRRIIKSLWTVVCSYGLKPWIEIGKIWIKIFNSYLGV